MTRIFSRNAWIAALTLAALVGAASTSLAASPASQTRLQSAVKPKGGDWKCLIWEKMSNGQWVCRLMEKTL